MKCNCCTELAGDMRQHHRTLLIKWQRAVSVVPLAKVLPPALGGADDTTNAAAFYGDKMLGAAVALAQRRTMGAKGFSADSGVCCA